MTLFFLALLALAWVVVFVPAVLRAREEAPVASTERFKKGMGMLAAPSRRSGRWIIAPGVRDVARKRRLQRRRRLFSALVFAAGATLVLALVRPALWDLHLTVDAILFSYAVLLVAIKRQDEEARHKLAYITPDEDAEPLQRARAVGELEFEEQPGTLLESYESLDPTRLDEHFEFYEPAHAGGRNG